jgi:hypothetical protein
MLLPETLKKIRTVNKSVCVCLRERENYTTESYVCQKLLGWNYEIEELAKNRKHKNALSVLHALL